MRAALVAVAFAALALPATSSATFSAASGGEPPVTNTASNSHWFNWTTVSQPDQRFCINVYRGGSFYADRGCLPSNTSFYSTGQSSTFSQTETPLPHGTFVGVHPTAYINSGGTAIISSCSGDHCRSSTLIDLSKPQLTVFAAGTADYTNNPQIPLHIDYYDDLSHPWFAGGNNAAVFICQSRSGACSGHTYVPQCSVVGLTRFSSPGSPKQNTFDCMYDFTSQPDGLVVLCARAADQSIPDPDPTANEGLGIFPTHVNQFVDPATGSGWTADKANLADSTCGSVILDRGAPTIDAQASDASPGTGDLVTFSASGSDGLSGISGPYTWDFGDNTQNKQGANITHTYTSPGTYNVTLTGHDGAGNEGSDSLAVVVRTEGGTGDDGTVVQKPPDNNTIGGGEGTQKATVGSLKVVAPKKYRIRNKRSPIRLALIASKGGAFQAALTKGAKVLSKGAGVLPRAGTYGFKLKVPKRGTAPGFYKLRVTYVADGATSGRTKTLTIRFYRPRSGRVAAVPAAAGPTGPVNVDAGPPLAPGYGR
ncbi:MAG TPA: PKD domain-containing protein [Solirubrobacterales bacterium]|nr:PKD domain-containing protein [Solirubrobacterales bacterium]